MVLLLLMLINIRNLFGVVSLVVTGAIVLRRLLVRVAAGPGRFRVRGGVVPADRRRAPGHSSCRSCAAAAGCRSRTPTSSAHLTHLPALFWVGVFCLVNLAALVVGAFLLAGQWLPEGEQRP